MQEQIQRDSKSTISEGNAAETMTRERKHWDNPIQTCIVSGFSQEDSPQETHIMFSFIVKEEALIPNWNDFKMFLRDSSLQVTLHFYVQIFYQVSELFTIYQILRSLL